MYVYQRNLLCKVFSKINNWPSDHWLLGVIKSNRLITDVHDRFVAIPTLNICKNNAENDNKSSYYTPAPLSEYFILALDSLKTESSNFTRGLLLGPH